MILGLDIGGANTKAASADGSFAESLYLPLWRGAPLKEALDDLAMRMRPHEVAVVITGELADCYPSKREGVKRILEAVEASFPCSLRLWGFNGFGWSDPLELAAANWSASAHFIAKEIGDCLFVDMGSTTTDLIPINGRPLAQSSDLARLMKGELIYTGMLRTGLAALLPWVQLEGRRFPPSSELFAIAADAYLAVGAIVPEGYTCDAPDSGAKDRDGALRRLSRTVCADLDELGEEGALSIARQAIDRQEDMIRSAIIRLLEEHDLGQVVAAGLGEDVISRAADGIDCVLISETYGKKISRVFPAYAVARLAERA
ncbi:MAG: hydantoinase [Methanotrichaceae archaeon]|nr:hydantoinase [Methanotrichaceae archaeon]